MKEDVKRKFLPRPLWETRYSLQSSPRLSPGEVEVLVFVASGEPRIAVA